MKMKIRLVYAALLSVALLLLPQMSGCMSAIQPRSETTGGERAGSETESVKPEERIASLERQLEELRTAQESKNNAYEARIRKLERALSAADAPTAADGLAFTYEENGKGVTLTGWSGNTKTLVIPQTVDGKPVTALGDGLFREHELERVTIPDGVRTIGWFAFSGCYCLTSVTLPASVESIGYGAFEHCAASLRFICPSGSYAAKYASSYGIPTSAQ